MLVVGTRSVERSVPNDYSLGLEYLSLVKVDNLAAAGRPPGNALGDEPRSARSVTRDGLRQGRGVVHVADHRLRSECFKLGSRVVVSCHSCNNMAGVDEWRNQADANHSGCASEEDAHRTHATYSACP
jgi:hypothetical protein